MTDKETLEDLKALYRMVMASPELVIQLSLSWKMSLADTFKNLKSTLATIEEELREAELEEAKRNEKSD
jgi:hypothetical protein